MLKKVVLFNTCLRYWNKPPTFIVTDTSKIAFKRKLDSAWKERFTEAL